LLVIAKQTQAFGNIAHPPQTLRSNRTDIRFKFTPILLNFDICLSHGGLIPCIFIFAFSLRLAEAKQSLLVESSSRTSF